MFSSVKSYSLFFQLQGPSNSFYYTVFATLDLFIFTIWANHLSTLTGWREDWELLVTDVNLWLRVSLRCNVQRLIYYSYIIRQPKRRIIKSNFLGIACNRDVVVIDFFSYFTQPLPRHTNFISFHSLLILTHKKDI